MQVEILLLMMIENHLRTPDRNMFPAANADQMMIMNHEQNNKDLRGIENVQGLKEIEQNIAELAKEGEATGFGTPRSDTFFENQKRDWGLEKPYLTKDSIAFYLLQVWLYNLGVRCISENQKQSRGSFQIWTEDKGDCGSEEIGSCILSFLETLQDRHSHLVA
ncbi:hypothetical protein ILUMI_05430 [Ignelater luminosus]|uniref:Uncharacterized protein n=1 Tax=Ignelater luminosus TaxID=2038154 RepID=A0A8K0DCB8_IGNLU|nr:hypothetical protein ILUMI_05430 [Ignelater luminosus]